jgi:hypothetical protein
MKVSCRSSQLLVAALSAAALFVGCPLPFDYAGRGAGNSHTKDPSSPTITAAVTVTYSEQGGTSGNIPNNGSFITGKTTTVTLSTTTENAVIYYTDDGSQITNYGTPKKINGSSGQFTITRSTSVQTADLHAVAIGPNMLPSQAVLATVTVTPYPILSVTCDKPSVSEDGGTATFTITSSSASAADINVKLLTGGTYTSADLTGFPASGNTFSATLVHSTTTISLPITGVHNAVNANPTVTLTVQQDSNTPPAYTVGAPPRASLVIQNDASHTVTYLGNGNLGGTVPTDSNYYLAGATVTVLGNSGNLVRAGYFFGGWIDATGRTYAGGATFTMGSTNVTLTAVWYLVQSNYYVNAATGNDTNAGTTSAPFKTITRALGVATSSGQIVHVAAGTYSTANGETFPLYISAGVELRGSTSGFGSGFLIQGGGNPSGYTAGFISCTVVMGTQSILDGFTVTNNSGIATFPMGVLLDQVHSSDGAIVTMNTITGNPHDGIYVNGGSSGGSIYNNNFNANGEDLAFVSNGGNGMGVFGNSFGDMVELDTLGPDLGGGAAGSPGGNAFLGAPSSTYFSCGGTVYAEFNHWNHNPPTVGPVQSGYDVGVSNSTTVNTTGNY